MQVTNVAFSLAQENTPPLSRVTAAAFPLASEYATASSPARDHACFLRLRDRLPYTAYVESPALAWRLYLVYTYCESLSKL